MSPACYAYIDENDKTRDVTDGHSAGESYSGFFLHEEEI